MHRLFKSLILLSLLVGQFQLATHAYEEHAEEQSCDVCITLKQQDQTIEASACKLFIQSSYNLAADKNQLACSNQQFTFYSVRAPPSYL